MPIEVEAGITGRGMRKFGGDLIYLMEMRVREETEAVECVLRQRRGVSLRNWIRRSRGKDKDLQLGYLPLWPVWPACSQELPAGFGD